MLTRELFASRFSHRAVFGMVHLRALPGAPLFGGSMDEVIERALADAGAIEAAGCDGIVFENFGDRPFAKGKVEPETIAALTRVVTAVAGKIGVAFGINVLRNDAAAAIGIAAATGAAFIRINVHTGIMYTDQGVIEGEAATTLRKRAAIAPAVAIFADHMVKHAVPPQGIDPVQSAKDLRLRGLADAIIVSGAETGSAPDAERVNAIRAITDAPLLVGSGVTIENARLFAAADGAIVGTSIKRDGDVDQPVDVERAKRLVEAFKRA